MRGTTILPLKHSLSNKWRGKLPKKKKEGTLNLLVKKMEEKIKGFQEGPTKKYPSDRRRLRRDIYSPVARF